MTKRSECVDTARKALNEFSGEELEEYLNDFESRMNELKDENVAFAREIAMEETNKSLGDTLLENAARADRNLNKFEKIKLLMDKGSENYSFLDKTKTSTDHNIETANNAAEQEGHTVAFGEMEKEQLTMLTEGKVDDQICSVADGGEHHDPKIKAMGKALNKYIEWRNARLIKSDAMTAKEISKDRYFKAYYDHKKMVAMGKENWVALMKQIIDIKGTFKNTRDAIIDGELNMRVIDKKIGNTYDNIIQGNGNLFTKATVAPDMEKVERSRHMFYKYKNWESWQIGNKTFGQGSLFKAWLMDLRTSANQIGMADIMGSAPRMMWNEIRKIQVEKHKEGGIKENIKHQQADALFNNLLGVNKGAADPTLNNITGGVLAITSVARNGLIVLKSFSDLSNIAGINMRAGVGFWGPQINALTNIFNLMPNAAAKNLARTMSSAINHQMGAIVRNADVTGFGAILNKLSNKFFYTFGLERFEIGNKINAMTPAMERYGKDSSKSFDRLNHQQQSYLKRFNISEAEWDGLRAKTQDKLFSTDNVTNMTDTEIKNLWDKSDKLTPLDGYRTELFRKVFAFFDTLQEFSVLNPTAYSNMLLTGNMQAGTLGGTALRILNQFKSFPIQTMRRIYIGGMQDMDSYQAKLMYATHMAISIIGLTTLGDALISISKGLTPADPTKMSNRERIKYYTKMSVSGLGVFSTIMNDKINAKNVAAAIFGTPSWHLVVDPLITATSLLHGDLNQAKKDAKDFVNYANPFGTFPVISPFIDAMLGNKPYLEPGQHSLF